MIDNIIAVDFDGTLCKNRYPDIGEPIQEVIDKLLEEQKNGAKLILWTCRCDKELTDAVEWCERHGIIFDAVNDHLQELKETFGNNTRKIFAHQYWDDHAVNILKELGIVTMKLPVQELNLTDKEIIKALETCAAEEWLCDICCYKDKCPELKLDALDLINRQKAEIESLISAQETLQNNLPKIITDEAIKNFVEKVIFEIVNKPSEFTAEQGTADFLSGSAHRQNEIIDIIEKMAVICDDDNI